MYCIRPNETSQLLRSPLQTVGAIIRGFKSAVSGQIGFSIWQRDMYEHIIRDVNDYVRIVEYIERNPETWGNDMFYN
jgi:REP element-mobilizing transposase RayT